MNLIKLKAIIMILNILQWGFKKLKVKKISPLKIL